MPSSLTLEALLPYAPGKQRWTDQTFVVTGELAHRMVGELEAAAVYTGASPAGCQPDAPETTVRVKSAGRLLSFLDTCGFLWVGTHGDEMLTAQPLLDDIDRVEARSRPTSTRQPPADQRLTIDGVTIMPNRRNEPAQVVGGTITVTQDGRLVARRRVKAGAQWTLTVVPGQYDITATVPGVHCLPGGARIPVAHGGSGTQAICDING